MGNTLGSITRRSHKSPTACSPRASTKLGSLSLASSGHLTPQGQPGGGTRPPGSAPLHRRPPRRPPPATKRLRAAACGIMLSGRSSAPSSHHASGPQEPPSRRSGNCASGTSFVSSTSEARAATSGRYGVKCCPRHSRRFRAPIVACAAWSFLRDHLTPRPAVAKSTYRFCVRKIRHSPALQNICNRRGREVPPQSSGAGRSRLGKHGSSRDLQAVGLGGVGRRWAFRSGGERLGWATTPAL